MTAPLLLLAASPTYAQDRSFPLPFRAFRVEGGAIAIQSGAMRDPETPPLGFGKMRYPVRYFLVLKNEASAPVWAEVEWRFPDDKPKKIESDRLDPGDAYSLWRRKFGLICDQPLPVQIRIHSDAERRNLLKIENVSLHFPCELKEPFLEQFAHPTASMILPGWREMSMPPEEVPGSAAAVGLQKSVQYVLWKEESKDFPDCVHKAVKAEGYLPPASANIDRMTEIQRQRAELARGRGDLRFEKWLVKSCDQPSTYEVLIITSPEGGTEFRVEKIGEVMLEAAEPQGQQAGPPAAPSDSPPAPAQSERLTGLLDGREWKLGYEAKQPNQEITEYVLPGETVGNWTELVSIQVFPGVRTTPGELMLWAKETTLKKCPKTMWNVIHQSSNEVLFEYKTEKCRGVDDEYEVVMIFRSDRALHQVSYASKKLPVSEAQRTQWIAIIEKVVTSGSLS